jgi:hypothetical protein
MLFLFYVTRFLGKYGVYHDAVVEREQVTRLTRRLIQLDGSSAAPSLNEHRVFCDIASLYAVLDGYLNIGLWKDGTMRVAATRMCKFLESVIELFRVACRISVAMMARYIAFSSRQRRTMYPPFY